MDPVQVVVTALAFASFILLSVVALLTVAPNPVPVRITPEPSAESLRNQLYI